MKYETMVNRVLITGGAGFIGSNLIENLLKNHIDVVTIDNLSSGRISNIQNFISSIDFIESDIESFNLEVLENIDAVVHLAAQPSVPISLENFKSSSTTNLISSVNIISFCIERKIPLVYASSSAIYGELEFGSDLSEDIDLLSPYAADKKMLETYTGVAHKAYGLRSIGLRFFNVYGPKQDPNSDYSGVISIFIEKMLNNENVHLRGGYQTRDFVYIDDVVKSIIASLKVLEREDIYDCINVLTGNSISIESLLNKISSQLAITPIVKKVPLPIGDPEKSDGNTSKLKKTLGLDLKSFTDLNSGLSKTINYIRNYEA